MSGRLHPAGWVRPVPVLVAGLVASAVVVVSQGRRLYFFGDEWSFLLDRSLGWNEIFVPHNEHWSTLPLIAYRVMFHVFGIDHHLVYALLPIAIHVGICVVSYLLMRRHGIGAWAAVLATLLLAFLCGNLGENPLWGFQIGFLGSLLTGLLAVYVWELAPSLVMRVGLTWAALVVSMLCSGMALPMVVLVGVYVLLLHGPLRSLLATVPPTAVFLLWYAVWGRDAQVQAPPATENYILDFAGLGLSTLWEAVTRLPGTGGAILLALLVVPLVLPATRPARALAVAGALTCVAMFVLLGVSRAGLGFEAAKASRYAYFGITLTLPAFALVVDAIAGRIADSRVRQGAFAFALVALMVSGAVQTVSFTDGRLTLIPRMEQRILGARDLLQEDQPLLSHALDPVYSPNLTTDALQRPDVADALPDSAANPLGVLDAAALLQVASSRSSLDLPDAPVVGTHHVSGELPEEGCASMFASTEAWLDVPPSADGAQVLLKGVTGALPGQLLQGRLVSVPVSLPTYPRGTYVGSTVAEGTLRITLLPGRFEVCRG
jgi:hypothetical protein